MRGLSHKAKNIKITLGSAVSVAALIFMGGVMIPGGDAAAETVQNSTGLNLSVNISQVMAIRTLDATATSDIAALNFAITPTPDGVRQTNTTVVDVATSNVSGYKLMMNSDYRTDGTSSDTPSAAEFTTSLINTDSAIAATSVGQIATTAGSSTASSTSYWNYSKSWNESLGPEGQTKDFSSTNLASASLENLAIPAKATPDTVRDDVDMATSSSQTSISVNVNAATDKSSGIYKNELVFTAIANPIPVDYTLTFDKNTTDTVTNLPDPLTATTMATSYTFTIPDTSGEGTLPEMTRDGYSFIGWSTSASTRQGSGSGPDGLYIAGDTYTVVADDSGNPDYTTHGTGNATLYAIWKEAKDFWSITTMQEMTWEICQSVHYPDSTTSTSTSNLVTDKATYESKNITSDGTTQWVPTRTLIDDRDADGTGTKRSYTVSRLADGNCWMTENLKYDLLSLYNNGKRGIGSKNDGSTFEMTDSSFASGVSGYYTTEDNAYNYVINPNTKSISTTMYNSQLGDKTSQTEYYYNWTGATAGQGSQTQTSASGNINGSICPAGWVLPISDTGNQGFWDLYNIYYNSAAKFEAYPLALYRSGHLYSGSQNSATIGRLWYSMANNANSANGLSFGTSFVYTQTGYDKNYGIQVRCVTSRSV